ncbi:hypothetical protein [Microbacterium rhizomatis]|uniref:hypothetical protein n=1 Tax=Microbacterium rhizomatis TaxID=1631477 RepID=UPI001478A225|nr:hypothetical protein [Microbacterium rhizomatis]
MTFYNDLAAAVQRKIADLNWPPLLLERPFEVTSRAKTLDTLRQKLQRDRSTPLQNVQDIAGVRFEAEMSLDEQDAVVNAICGTFGHDMAESVRDMRTDPHSGYRAVHIWLRFPSRVEVQVRTHLQGQWANVYESAADVLGRGIRYDEMPEGELEQKLVRGLREMSTIRIARMEKDRNEIAKLDLLVGDLERKGITDLPEELRLRLDRLKTRGKSNEDKLKTTLAKLRTFFEQERERRA